MLEIFVEVVSPVFLMAGIGALIRRIRNVPSDSISQITLYIFAPALVFNSLAGTDIPLEEMGKIALFAVCLAAAMYLLSIAVARVLALGREGASAFLLTTLFMNAGNYGLPVALLAFGDAGVEFAVVFFVCQATLGGTLAVYLASRSQLEIKDALLSVVRMPLVYGTVFGLAVNLLEVQLPTTIGEPARILGNAAVPSMLMVLGIQLATRFSLDDLRSLASAVILRLVISAGAAYLLTLALGIDGLLQQVLVVTSAMPTAVFTTILATQFQARPSFVTNAVALGTLLSLLTLTVLITVVEAML